VPVTSHMDAGDDRVAHSRQIDTLAKRSVRPLFSAWCWRRWL